MESINETTIVGESAGPRTPKALYAKLGLTYNKIPAVLPQQEIVRFLMEHDDLDDVAEPEIRRLLEGPLKTITSEDRATRRRLLGRLSKALQSNDSAGM